MPSVSHHPLDQTVICDCGSHYINMTRNMTVPSGSGLKLGPPCVTRVSGDPLCARELLDTSSETKPPANRVARGLKEAQRTSTSEVQS